MLHLARGQYWGRYERRRMVPMYANACFIPRPDAVNRGMSCNVRGRGVSRIHASFRFRRVVGYDYIKQPWCMASSGGK